MLLPKPESRARTKRESSKAKLKAWVQVRRDVLTRDGHRCRACSSRQDVDVHHIRFRSAGGSDTAKNLAAICRICHADIHAYRLAVVGSDANQTLRFVKER